MDQSLPLPRRAAAEGMAAFALVFAGCGAIVADAERGGLGPNGVALAFGLVIMVMIYATGHLSGAHINPAVTIAFTLNRHFPTRDAAAYIAAQLIGATAGAVLLLAVWPDQPAQLGAIVPSVGTGSAFVYELVLTAFLMFVIMAVATDTRAVGAAAAIAIGGTVGLDALFGGPVTGASMNPARSFGPALARANGPTSGSTSPARSSARWRARWPTRWSAAPAPQRRRIRMAHALFVCLHNAGRSQMSQALFERAAGGRHTAASAGTQPGGRVHPQVVDAMRELDIDLAHRTPQALTHELAEQADLVVTMGCGDECPYIPGKRYVDWDLEDPAGLPLDEVRAIRDDIARRVNELVLELDQRVRPS